jgi:hypothetical protein
MTKFVNNDGGRSASKRPKQRLDCVVRAVAIACQLDYDDAYDRAAYHGRQSGRGMQKDHIHALLMAIPSITGRHIFPAVKGSPRMNIERFAEANPTGRFILQCAGHYVACVDGTIYDDGRPRFDACVYSAWEVQL